MTSRIGVAGAVIVVLGSFLVVLPVGSASSDEIQDVAVVNFPDLQQLTLHSSSTNFATSVKVEP